ncbi:MAG: tetratricopeptide repeat protein, partial [Leptospiraceae bacterium]|nr:tetratricopeptide repeat protein [Leptospiraceae bacterium]
KYLKMESNKEVQKMKDKAIAHKGSDSGKIASANINTSSSSTATTQKKESKKTTSKSIEPSKKSKTSTSTASKKPSKTSDKKITSESVPEQNVEANLWEEALSSIQKDDYISADKLLKKLLILAPKDKNYNYKAGIVKLRIGEFDKALELLEESRKLADKSDKTLLYYIHLNEGQLYQKISKLTEAEEHYVKAYNYNNSIPPLLGLTKLKFDSTKFNEVLEFTDNIIKLDPKNLEGLQYRGVSRVKLGNRKEGFQDLLKFSKLLREKHPDLKEVASEYQDGILYLGSYYSNRSKYKLAQKYLKMVQTSKMDSNTYSFSLGKTYFYTGKYDLAMIQLERTKNVPAAQYLIGKIFAIQKNIPKSKEYLAKAAEGKEIYWIKARFDKNYKDLMEYQDFSNFVINKGKIVPEKAAVINKPAVEEIKTEITPPQKEESKKEENSLNNQEISKP